MTPRAEWDRIADIVARILEAPADKRTSLIEAECPAGTMIRAEVESLLEDATAHGPLDRELISTARRTPQNLRFGPYLVTGLLGQGGMGTVYRAKRADGQFEREVAVKRIAGSIDNDALRQRFESERQILAALSHPHIAHLEDAGTTLDGTPFLIMELVEGEPLPLFASRLSIAERLRLFAAVCRAVHFAHQRLVVHRDLKPSNILVTKDGTPKLLDFGIAKMLGEAGTGATATMFRAMTPAFASPEQLRGEPVTTASDIYSLGVLLYEVASGARPYDLEGKTLAEALHQVCDVEPPPLGGGSSELRSVVQKAMAKAAEDRYASAEDLARDLENLLEGRPVTARPPSAGYILRKLAARYRKAVAAGFAVIVVILSVTAVALWQRQVAVAARARAERQFGNVRTLANAVLFEFSDRAAATPGSLELRKMMVERAMRSMDALSRDAAGDDALSTELATAYRRLGDILGKNTIPNLGDQAGALASYAKARAILEDLCKRHPDTLSHQVMLGNLLVDTSTIQSSARQPDAARASSAQALSLWQSVSARFPVSQETRNGLAAAYFRAALQTRSAESPKYLTAALRIYQDELNARPDDWQAARHVALVHKYMAGLSETTDPADSFAHLQSATELDQRRFTANPADRQAQLDYSFDLSMLGTYHENRKQFEQSAGQFAKATEIRAKLLEAEPKDTYVRERLAFALVSWGRMLAANGQKAQAREKLREGLDHSEAAFALTPRESSRKTADLARKELKLLAR